MRERVLEALREVVDPEVGINVVDLGLVYRVEAEAGRVRVAMTATSRACPVGPYLTEQAREAIRRRVPEAGAVEVELVWEPAWSPERISEEARRRLGWAE